MNITRTMAAIAAISCLNGCSNSQPPTPRQAVIVSDRPPVSQPAEVVPSVTTAQDIQSTPSVPAGFYRDRDGDLERIPERRMKRTTSNISGGREDSTEALKAKIAACDVRIDSLTQQWSRVLPPGYISTGDSTDEKLDAIDQQIQDTRRLKQSYEQQLTSQGSY